MIRNLILLLLLPVFTFAATTTTRQIDNAQNSTGGSAIAVPSTGTTFATDTNTLTLSSKTISGSSNTLTNIPVAAEMVQEVPSGSVNSSNVTFTLANTPGGAASVLFTLDGTVLTQGSGKDYTISGATITMATAPSTGQVVWASYAKH